MPVYITMFKKLINRLHTKTLPNLWIYIFCPAAFLTLELTYEETYMTWVHGPQGIIGFTFVYVSAPLVLLCILCVYLCYVWIAAFAGLSLLSMSLPLKPDLIKIALTIATLGLERISVEQWQALMTFFMGAPPY